MINSKCVLNYKQHMHSTVAFSVQNRLRLAEKSITDLTTRLMKIKESESRDIQHFNAEKKNLEQRIAEQNQTIHKLQERLQQPCPELRAAQKQVHLCIHLSPFHSSFQIKALKHKCKLQSMQSTTTATAITQNKHTSLMPLNHNVSGQHQLNRIPRPQIEKILRVSLVPCSSQWCHHGGLL